MLLVCASSYRFKTRASVSLSTLIQISLFLFFFFLLVPGKQWRLFAISQLWKKWKKKEELHSFTFRLVCFRTERERRDTHDADTERERK